MKIRFIPLLFVLLFSQMTNAQCPGALTCEGSQVFCEVSSLNGFMCSNPDFPNAGFPLASLCFGAGAPHNLNWWAFVGAGGALTLTFNLDLGDCRDGMGIQAGVFEGSCDGSSVWDCDAGCNTGTFQLSGTTLACETYYVWVDGCNSDVCDYTMSVAGNTTRPGLTRPMPRLTSDPSRPCLCGMAEICFPGYSTGCEPTLEWTVDGMPTGGPGMDCIEVEFPTAASRQICVTATIGNPSGGFCDQDMTCINVTPAPPEQRNGALRTLCPRLDPIIWHGMPITTSCIMPPCSARIQLPSGCCVDSLVPFQILPPEEKRGPLRTICPEDQPLQWHNQTIATSCIMPPCTARIEGPDGCLFDSIVPFNLLPFRPPGFIDTFLCSLPPRSPAFVGPDGRSYGEDQCMEEIVFQDPIFGCDTTVFLNLKYFKYSTDWQVDCAPCDGAVTLCPNIEYDPDCPEFNDGTVVIQLEWQNARGDALGITPGDGCIRVMTPGVYTANIQVSYRGRECMSTYFETFDVDSSFFPDAPTIDGDSSVCGSVPGDYVFLNPPNNVCEYNWTIQQGGGRIITPNALDTNAIQVDWSNSMGQTGLVCLAYKTDCGISEDTCFTVDFGGTPQISAGPDTNICGLTYVMMGIPDVPGGSWEQVDGPGPSNIQDENDPNSQVSVNDYGTYRFTWTESANDCVATDTVTVAFRPDPQALNIDTICGSEANDFTIRFDLGSGTAPFTIITGGGTITGSEYRSDTIPDNTPTTIVIQDSFGCELTFFIDHDCTCGNAVGSVSSDTLKFCGPNDQACIDYDPTGQQLVPGEDTIMFVLYSTPGMVQATQIGTSQDGCFSFDAMTMNLDQVYFLAAVVGRNDGSGLVDYNGGCVQIAEAQPVVWYTLPAPEAGADIRICGPVADLAGVSSVPGSTYRWLNAQGISIDDNNDLASEITLQSTYGTYQLILEETNAVCTEYDTVEVTFLERPESVNAKEICVDSVNRTNFDFIVCFDIQKGLPPYTLVQGAGTIDPMTNRFCSDPIMSLTPYDIIVEDANGCQFRITGTFNCDCGNSDPGTMDGLTIESCVDQCVTVQTNGSEILQADEIAEFILHEGSGSIIINELDRMGYDHTANPAEDVQFCFDAANGMIPGRTYYISRLIREQGNLDDPCERIAEGTPVVWNDYPTSDAGMDQDVCGLSANIGALPSLGSGAWSLANQPAGSNVIYATDLASQMITVDQYGSYTFQWREDNFGCADSASVTITFHDAPTMSNILVECDSVAENYRLYIEVTNGDPSTYSISGVVATLTNNTFVTEWIPSGTNRPFSITDVWDCQPFMFDTTVVCDCLTEIGSLTSTDDDLCIDECYQASYTGGTTDPNDRVSFILHDGDANTIGTQLDCNTDGRFCFDATSMNANQTYWVTAVAGNQSGPNCVDPADRCFVQTEGVAVTWYEYPDPDIAAASMVFTCQTDSIELTGSILNTLPGSISYSWTSNGGSICPTSNTNSNAVFVCASGTYILTTTHDISGCSTQDTIVIDRDAQLPNVTAGNDMIITCDQPVVTLDATGSDFGGDFNLTWFDPNGNPIGNTLTLQVSTPGTYRAVVINSLNDCSDESTVEVSENTTPPEASIDQLGQLSCTVTQIDLDGSGSINQGGIRSFTWSTTNGNILTGTNQSNVTIEGPGDYQLIVVDDENGCADTLVVNVQEIGNTLAALDVDAIDPTCFGFTDGRLVVNILGGVPPLRYSLNGGPFESSNVFPNLPPGDYDIVVLDQNGCEKDTMITLVEPGQIVVQAKPDLIKEAGSSISVDTLIEFVGGINRADADREYWINVNTGDTLNRLIIDSLTETVTFRVIIEKNGCFSSDLITIFVKYTRNVYVPNVIFPGAGSGNPDNQILTVHGTEDRIAQVNFMRVYDRWGEMVYSKDNIPYDEDLNRTTEGWDGTFNGEQVNPGVFIYHIEVGFKTSNGEPFTKEFSGDVTVLK